MWSAFNHPCTCPRVLVSTYPTIHLSTRPHPVVVLQHQHRWPPSATTITTITTITVHQPPPTHAIAPVTAADTPGQRVAKLFDRLRDHRVSDDEEEAMWSPHGRGGYLIVVVVIVVVVFFTTMRW